MLVLQMRWAQVRKFFFFFLQMKKLPLPSTLLANILLCLTNIVVFWVKHYQKGNLIPPVSPGVRSKARRTKQNLKKPNKKPTTFICVCEWHPLSAVYLTFLYFNIDKNYILFLTLLQVFNQRTIALLSHMLCWSFELASNV